MNRTNDFADIVRTIFWSQKRSQLLNLTVSGQFIDDDQSGFAGHSTQGSTNHMVKRHRFGPTTLNRAVVFNRYPLLHERHKGDHDKIHRTQTSG